MAEVTGRIERTEQNEAGNGGIATVLYVEGRRKSFWDWDGHAEAAGIQPGDEVRIVYSGDRFARVSAVEKLANGPAELGGEGGEAESRRNLQKVRQCCVKAAALVCQTLDVPLEDKAGLILHMAAEMEQWILRPG